MRPFIFRTYNTITTNPLYRYLNESASNATESVNTLNITVMETLVDNANKMIEIAQKKIPNSTITIEINQGLMKTIINKK